MSKKFQPCGGEHWRKATNDNRIANDEYPTPFCATRALLEVEQFSRTIREPACGQQGYISRVLEQHGHQVISADINPISYGVTLDFFEVKSGPRRIDIVTNPPYRHAQRFVEHAVALCKPTEGKVAMLMQIAFLKGIARYEWLGDYTPHRVHLFTRNIPYIDGKGEWYVGGGFQHAWFVWDTGVRRRKRNTTLYLLSPEHKHSEKCWRTDLL